MRRRAGAVFLLAGLLTVAAEARGDDDELPDRPPSGKIPSPRWFTLQTPHFDLHYYPEEQAFAERTAHIAERAYRLVTRYLNWRPAGRVSLTLNDQTDSANGFASSIPYNYIRAYAAPPEALDELSDFDDHIKLLITHELTHVIHLDTILSWCPRLIDTVLGKIYAPNLSQPIWFIEGVAVLMESRQTTAGRLRSSFYNMHLRVPFLEGRNFDIDQVTGIPLAYPQGSVPYLYGSSILQYMEDRYGPAKIREISHRYGDECIAGGLNRVTDRAVGRAYTDVGGDGIWNDWKRSLSHRYALESEEAARRGLTTGRRLTNDAPGPRGEGPRPYFFRDGSLVYNRQNFDQAPAYIRIDPATGERRHLANAYGGGPAAPTPDGRTLIVQRINFLPLPWRISGSSHLDWNDLFSLDLESGDLRPLTRGARARQPDVSPDGSQIACVIGAATGTRELAVVPIDGGAPRVLAPGAPGFPYTPAFSPDGRLIAYSRMKPGGYRDIHIYDLDKATDRALSVDRAMDIDPRFSPDGRFLMFASDRSGIYDVYAYELASQQLYQVTNVLGGAFQPVVSPDGKSLVYTGFSVEGFDLYTMPFEPATFRLAQPVANFRLDSPTDLDSAADSPDDAPEDAAAVPFVTQTVDYQPWRYMYPRTWKIQYLDNPLGYGNTLFLETGIQDPVANHSISGFVLVPGDLKVSARVDYAYLRLWPSFGVSLRRTVQQEGGLVLDGVNVPYQKNILGAAASIGLPLRRTPLASTDLFFGYDYTAYGPADAIPIADPTAAVTRRPEVGPDANLFLDLRFNNVKSWALSISGQQGRSLQLYLRLSDPALGGRFRTTEMIATWAEFFTPPWARLHAIALLAGGGIGIGDKRSGFSLGGFVEQDLVRSLFLNQRAGGFYLRGYPPGSFSGDTFQMFSAEYRAPLVWIERGYQTFPLYLRRIWGAAFVDAGNAYQGAFRWTDLNYDIGAEMTLQFNLAYYLESVLKIGYAHGFTAPGGDQFYFLAAASF